MMNKESIKLNDMKIYSASSGKEYVEMLVPEGWTSTIDRYEDWYGGSPYMFVFRITNTSPDGDCSIAYYSPFSFVDDEMNEYSEGTVDENGDLHFTVCSLEEYLDSRVRQRLSDVEELTFIEHIPAPENDQRSREHYARSVEKYRKNDLMVVNFYYSRGTNVYTYRKDGRLHYFINTGVLEASDLMRWNVIEERLDEKQLLERYPDCCYDEDNDCYLYPDVHRCEWDVDQYLEMDCLEEDYDVALNDIFVPVSNSGVSILDDIWNEYVQLLRQSRNKETETSEEQTGSRIDPEEQRKIDAIWAEYRRWKSDLDYDTYRYVRDRQEQTGYILNSAHDHSEAVHDRMNRGWSDTFMGNGRFIDSLGREHVIHTTDNYAYRRGNVYVTTNSILDRPFDSEELIKKKY